MKKANAVAHIEMYVECPHCGYTISEDRDEINYIENGHVHSDGLDHSGIIVCPNCGKKFWVNVEVVE